MDDARRILIGSVRESFGRAVYSHKTQETCADILLGRLKWIRGSQIVLSGLATAGYANAVFGTSTPAASIIGLTVSTALLIINAYLKESDLGQVAQKHRQAGSDLWLIREQYQSLLADLEIGAQPIQEYQKRRDDLIKQLYEVYRGAPSTNSKAYRIAQKKLQKLEDMTFTDEEIDKFLPKELKKTAVK
jgi:hypothetical protein